MHPSTFSPGTLARTDGSWYFVPLSQTFTMQNARFGEMVAPHTVPYNSGLPALPLLDSRPSSSATTRSFLPHRPNHSSRVPQLGPVNSTLSHDLLWNKCPASTAMNDADIAFAMFAAITLALVYRDPVRRKQIAALATNPQFILGSLPVIAISWWTLSSREETKHAEKLRRATKQGLIAFIIAVLAHLDLKVAPFYLVWMAAYYLEA
jgi:hypothetical protein